MDDSPKDPKTAGLPQSQLRDRGVTIMTAQLGKRLVLGAALVLATLAMNSVLADGNRIFSELTLTRHPASFAAGLACSGVLLRGARHAARENIRFPSPLPGTDRSAVIGDAN